MTREAKICLPLEELVGKKVRDDRGYIGTIINMGRSPTYPIHVNFDYDPKYCISQTYTADGYKYHSSCENNSFITLIEQEQTPVVDSAAIDISSLEKKIIWIMETTGVSRLRAIEAIMGE
jgi:hypothetical protein